MGNTSECQFSNVVHMVLPLHNAEINSQNTNFLYTLQRLNGPRTHMRALIFSLSLPLRSGCVLPCSRLAVLYILVHNKLCASVCLRVGSKPIWIRWYAPHGVASSQCRPISLRKHFPHTLILGIVRAALFIQLYIVRHRFNGAARRNQMKNESRHANAYQSNACTDH